MKIELNKIFTVEKGNRKKRWKVIEHPYFSEQLILVSDYCGLFGAMKNGCQKEDCDHLNGKTTLETAYEDAYILT